MAENRTAALRKEITSEFLRTIVWVDDEIKPDVKEKLGDPFRDFFYPIARDFQTEGFLVHLHPFDSSLSSGDDIFSSDDSSFESMVKLAKKADIIILDWHLGASTPENSTRLLKELANDPASRFVVVLSKYADKFADEMKEAGLIRSASEKKEDAESKLLFSKDKAGYWANTNGTHLTVLSKNVPNERNEDRSISAKEIVNSIHQLISSSYSDYLHWVTLEIASKIRARIPAWLQAVPRGTDVAVLGELLSQTTEAKEFIPEFLLDDLVHVSKSYHLKVLDPQNANISDWENRPYDLDANPQSREDKFIHLAKEISKIEPKDIEKIQGQVTQENRKLFLQSHASFTQFCENFSGQFEDAPPVFGAVYKKTPGETKESQNEDSSIYICISQSCDCLRKNKLILIKGSASNEAKQGETMLTFQGGQFRFDAGAENLLTADRGA
jgi:hypothetical protein